MALSLLALGWPGQIGRISNEAARVTRAKITRSSGRLRGPGRPGWSASVVWRHFVAAAAAAAKAALGSSPARKWLSLGRCHLRYFGRLRLRRRRRHRHRRQTKEPPRRQTEARARRVATGASSNVAAAAALVVVVISMH